jgi:hypothetical protein
MRRLILLVVVASIALVVVIALVTAFSLLAGTVPRSIPPSTQHIPIYPNATQLHQDYTSITNVKRVDFQTSASPQTIQNYYKGILLKQGWTLDSIGRPATPDSLYFSYVVQYQQYDGGFSFHTVSYGYAFDLVIQQLDNGETSVHIKLVVYPPM